MVSASQRGINKNSSKKKKKSKRFIRRKRFATSKIMCTQKNSVMDLIRKWGQNPLDHILKQK